MVEGESLTRRQLGDQRGLSALAAGKAAVPLLALVGAHASVRLTPRYCTDESKLH
jgi:hypothetical protein